MSKITAFALAFILACLVILGGALYLLYLLSNTNHLDGIMDFLGKIL